MSRKFEQIGRINAAVIGLPEDRLGIALDILSKLCSDGAWKTRLTEVSREGLKPIAQAVDGMFDPAKYFVTRDGLHVWPEFATLILPVYQGLIPKRGIEGVDSVDLPRNMYDREIVAEYLGGEEEVRKHAFTPNQVAGLIDTQKDGKAGVLLNNGYANILYMIGVGGVLLPVSVDWRSDRSLWSVDAYQFDDDYWSAGHRVIRNKRCAL